MYLNSLTLKNFRSFKSSTLSLQKDLTILVGENNSGKSNAIDAIRLLTPPLSGRRDIFCQETDIRIGSGSSFELIADYDELNDAQQGSLITASKGRDISGARFGLSYDAEKSGFPTRPKLWAGSMGNVPESGCHDLIRHVYLPALRDARYALASGNPTRVLALLKHFLFDGGDEESLVSELGRRADHDLFERINKSVDVGMSQLTGGVREQEATLGFSRSDSLIDIARDLRFSLADKGIGPEDLSISGHGYANLLYMATIAVELENVSSADLTLFLVEEPEAHLHPQLQSAVLAFLKLRATKSRSLEKTLGKHAGEVQVIVATHSPNLTASVSSDKIVFLRAVLTDDLISVGDQNDVGAVEAVKGSPSESAANSENAKSEEVTQALPLTDARQERRETRSIALAELLLKPDKTADINARRKIDRYIDVTKAAFLFGGRVFLVEGIAEAILLPIFAEKFVLNDDEKGLLRFRSTTFVPIDGVDFSPYVRLLTAPKNGICIADRLIVVTDGDGPIKDGAEHTPGQIRQQIYNKIAEENGVASICQTFINDYTLETELLIAGNGETMKQSYLELHSRSGTKWDEAVSHSGDELAKKMHELFKDVRKGDYAQAMAQRIEDGASITIPGYLTNAIKAVAEL